MDRRRLARGAVVVAFLLGSVAFAVEPTPDSPRPRMHVRESPDSARLTLFEETRPILVYNVAIVEPGERLASIAPDNRKYARPRADYIHPLYGPHGETLTLDWPLDHPHHRGIYWAWPEVEWGRERGDLHALQRVFARPFGRPTTRDGTETCEIASTQRWLWEDRQPIVEEQVVLRARRADAEGRSIDFELRLRALEDDVTVARRETRLYGGLNIRLATPANQVIAAHTDSVDSPRFRSWSDLAGCFDGTHLAGLTVLQHRGNPLYPGDWIQYPEISWCQPTFPAAGRRFPLRKDATLVLRFRFRIHSGSTPSPESAARQWDAFHAEVP